MERIRLYIIAALIFAAIVLQCSTANAMELTDVGVKYQKFFDNNYSSLIDGRQNERVELFLNTDLLPSVFWNNRVHGTTTPAKYQFIGWEFEFGVRVTDIFSVQYRHHSQHNLDSPNPFGTGFNVEDSVGFTLRFMPPKRGGSVFGRELRD